MQITTIGIVGDAMFFPVAAAMLAALLHRARNA